MPGDPAARPPRSDVIDGFRALAILIVLVFHYTVRWAPPLNPGDYYHYAGTYPEWLRLGQFGVHIFFVISGLVIAMTIVKSGSVLDFAVRRLSRLYPAYVVAATLVTLVVVASGGPFHVSVKDYLATLTMAALNLGAQFVDGAYWSLLVEIKFYFWVAVSFVVLKRRFWIGVIAIGAVGTALHPFAPRLAEQALLASSLPLFLIGMAAWYHIFNAERVPAAALLLTGLALYAANAGEIVRAVADPALIVPAHVLILGGTALMLVLLRFWSGARLGPLAYVGRASYSWYLVHQRIGVTLIGWLTMRFGVPDLPAFLAATALSLAIASAMFEWVEKPAQRIILRAWHHGRAHRLDRPKIDAPAA